VDSDKPRAAEGASSNAGGAVVALGAVKQQQQRKPKDDGTAAATESAAGGNAEGTAPAVATAADAFGRWKSATEGTPEQDDFVDEDDEDAASDATKPSPTATAARSQPRARTKLTGTKAVVIVSRCKVVCCEYILCQKRAL
jgi:hypothetical protein